VRGKEIKRETLVELIDYINTPSGQKILTESLVPDILQMIRVNIFRTLPPSCAECSPDEEDPSMEAMWPHLQVVYEFFLRFIVSTEVNGKMLKRHLDHPFLRRWIDLFDAAGPRERDYVKTVLHRIYGKFLSHRSFIRRAISEVFFHYIYESGR